jgi:hypothetical protein
VYSSPNIIKMINSRRMRWSENVARRGEKRNAYRILVRKSEGKKPLGGPRRRYKNNNNIDFREIGWGGMDWINLGQDSDQWRALVNTVMKYRIPYNIVKLFSSRATGGFSRRTQHHGVGWLIC